jgi:hypothetical protein
MLVRKHVYVYKICIYMCTLLIYPFPITSRRNASIVLFARNANGVRYEGLQYSCTEVCPLQLTKIVKSRNKTNICVYIK